MGRRARWLAVGLAALACARPPPPEPGRSRPHDWEPEERCPSINIHRGQTAFKRAGSFLETLDRDTHAPKEVFDRGMADLGEAAQNGHLEGQYLFATTAFGVLSAEHVPETKHRDDYVRALVFARIAALRGHPDALHAFPGIDQKTLPARFARPLDAVPRAWLADVFKDADHWLACAPPRARDRYLPPGRADRGLEKTDSGWRRGGDPEGPMLRVVGRVDSAPAVDRPLSSRLLAAVPGIYVCYTDLLGRIPEALSSLSIEVELKADGGRRVEASGDPELNACAGRVMGHIELVGTPGTARLQIALFPRALLAPELPEAPAGASVETWAEDSSCWTRQVECGPKKLCATVEPVRVRCQNP